MAGLSFLAKKSWHTSNLSNQEKVWLAEQKAQAEAQKVKELQTQIQLEREKEEFERLAGKKSKGDRGVDWMYEEGGGPAYGEDAKLEAAREEEKNEAYLLGKEYVPQGQEKHSGDFAVAATMGGVLEKASTRGATIGAGENVSGGGEVLRLKDDTSEHVMDEGRSEFNREFHLRHEDPMFAVHQKRERQIKEVEKKRNLMERAGLVVKEVKRGADGVSDTHENDYDGKERSRKRKKHHKHHHRDRSSSVSSRSSSYSRERRHRKKREKKHKRHRHERSRHERRRSRSRDRSEERSTDSIERDSRHRRHKDRYDDKNEGVDRRDSDRHSQHHHERKRDRSTSRERSEERYNNERDSDFRHQHREDHNINENQLDEFGRSRHHASGERRRDYMNHRDENRDRRRERHSSRQDERHGRNDYDRSDSRRSRSRSPRNGQRHRGDERKRDHTTKEENPKPDHTPKKEGYGLIGTSLSGIGREKSSNNHDTKQPASLGPDARLLAAKRQEVERERQSRFDDARRRGGHDGRSREDRELALEEMERNARNREYSYN